MNQTIKIQERKIMIKKILFLLAVSMPGIAQDSPPIISIDATEADGAVYDFAAPAPGGSPMLCSPAPGTLMPVGMTTITCSFVLDVNPLQTFPIIGLPLTTTAHDATDGDIAAECVQKTEVETECTATNSQGNSTSATITILPNTGASIYIQWSAPTTDNEGTPIPGSDIEGYRVSVYNVGRQHLTTYTTPTNAAHYNFIVAWGDYELSVIAVNIQGERSDPSKILRVVV